MKWNKIDADNLPEDGQRCYAYCPVQLSGYVTLINFNENDTEYWLAYYTHWMPFEFPKPPQS